MCGLCKLNAAALDTTVACGYNGIDQHNLGLLPPLRGLIVHAASGQLLNGGAPSTLFHPPSTPPLCVPLPTFRSGEAASAIRKRLQIRLADADRNGSTGIPDALLAARVAMGN